MASLNGAQIQSYIQQNYPYLNVTPDLISNVMNNSQGGDPSKIDSVLQQNPQVQQQTILNNAQQLQNLQVQANQPAIQTLASQYNPDTGGGALVDKYNALLDSIKGVGSVAVNQATLGASNALGARGILPSSALAQQSIGSALLPVTSQIQQNLSQVGLGEQQDLGNIANQIAGLRAGNVQGAISGATNILGAQNALTAAGLEANATLGASQNYSQAQIQAAQAYNQYHTLNPSQSLVNTFGVGGTPTYVSYGGGANNLLAGFI